MTSLLFILILLTQNNYVFGPSIRVNDDPPGTSWHGIRSSGQHGIACRGDTVYVVFADQRDIRAVYFSRSTDAGQTWSQNIRIGGGMQDFRGHWASIALDAQGDVFVAWESLEPEATRNIYFVKSTDAGISWSDSVLVNDTTRSLQWHPSIAVDSSGQKVFIAWADTRSLAPPIPNYDIYFARSTDGGLTFSPSIRVDDTGSDPSWQLRASVGCTRSGDTVYVAWDDERNDSPVDVYFARSIDAGSTFEPNILVNDTVGIVDNPQWNPSLWVSSSGHIYVVWMDFRSGANYQVYFDKSVDGGVGFGQDAIVSDSAAPASYPSITADDADHIYVAWLDVRNLSTSELDIYFSYSIDGGQSFSPDVRVNDLLGYPGAWDQHVSIAVNNTGMAFIAWETDRNDPLGYEDIYCATGSKVGIDELVKQTVQLCYLRISPNPFKQALSIQLPDTEMQEEVTLNIYDISGQRVKTITGPTSDHITWDGTDVTGSVLPAGVYFCRFMAEGTYFTKKIVKID